MTTRSDTFCKCKQMIRNVMISWLHIVCLFFLEFLQLISSLKQPILTIIGDNSPPYSLSQMKAIASLKNIQTISLSGTLGMAEEHSHLIAPYIREFCYQ